jgi:hypothetical protein
MRKHSLWKIVGLAGLAGVAATGVAVVRSERRRRAYTPDDVRTRLHQRVASTIADAAPVEPPGRASRALHARAPPGRKVVPARAPWLNRSAWMTLSN